MPEIRAGVDVHNSTPSRQLVIERLLKASPDRSCR